MNTALATTQSTTTELALQGTCSRISIPVQDYSEFMSLSREQRQIINITLEAIAFIDDAKNILTGCEEAARIIKNQYPELKKFSKSSLYNKYNFWKKGGHKKNTEGRPVGPFYQPGDWHFFIDNYNNGGKKLPQEFIDYLVTEYAKTTRENDSVSAIHRRLKKDWLDGKPIPPYGTADEWYLRQGKPRPRGRFIRDKDLPDGWSERNIGRNINKALPRRQLKKATQGQLNRVANNWASQLLRDRSQLLPFQLTTIDDVRLDLQCRMYLEGKWQIVYLDAIFHMDVATGYILGYGIKGRATRSEFTEQGRAAGTKMSIDSNDVRHLLLTDFEQYGLPPYECRMLCENATAKLSGADEVAFLSLLQNFHIDYSGMGRGKLLKSGFMEEWGRPGIKGWIESWFHLLHTSINHLPGTTGRRYELSRGDHNARVKHTVALIRRAEKLIEGPLTPDHPLAQQLSFPLMTVDEANLVVGEMVDALNWRVDHSLQGFERVFEFKDITGRWLPENALNKLPANERVGIELIPRMESPAERFRRLILPYASKFQKLDPITKSVLYLNKREVTVNNGKITVNDQRITSERMVFVAQDINDFSAYEGREGAILAYISDDYGHAICADVETGRHIGTMERQGRVNLLDFEALGKRAGEVHRDMESELAVVRTYLSEEEDRLSRINERNEQLFNQEHPRSTVQSAAVKIKEEKINKRSIDQMIDEADDYELPSKINFQKPDEDDYSDLI